VGKTLEQQVKSDIATLRKRQKQTVKVLKWLQRRQRQADEWAIYQFAKGIKDPDEKQKYIARRLGK